ncbi:unnamed protein product [Rangifer tarandus platyrhynchus]|uniref:Uncharacterized protein n=1 Tax=Rangifer tarandus platyrhynchus TaxID=3082113 RepID=A0ABN9A1S1_RANTA|nr:unnamed protein product [Rangifer tarandus platyrhynchus]
MPSDVQAQSPRGKFSLLSVFALLPPPRDSEGFLAPTTPWSGPLNACPEGPAGQQGLLRGSRGSEKTPAPPTSFFLAIPCRGVGLCLAQLLCWVVAQVYICFVRWPMTVHSV